MAPKPDNLKLSKDALQGQGGEGAGKKNGRPSSIRLAIGGGAGVPAIDQVTRQYKDQGFGKDKNVKLSGLVYEMNPGEQADKALDSFNVAFESPGNVPVTLIHPLTGAVDVNKLPAPNSAPPFAQICFALPSITKASDVQGDNEKAWLDLLTTASERNLTLELAIAPNEETREAVEKLLGKLWDHEVESAKKSGNAEEVNTKGVRLLIDALGSPPLNQSSSQLVRSKETESWSDFVSRLALNPRTFLKISPLPIPSSVLPTAVGVTARPVDLVGGIVGSTARSAADLAAQAVTTAEAATTTSVADRRDELQQRLRVFLETALEAFGEERLVWTSYLSAGSTVANSFTGSQNKEDEIASLSEPEQWFENVVATLNKIGVGQSAHDKIFSDNVSKVYRT